MSPARTTQCRKAKAPSTGAKSKPKRLNKNPTTDTKKNAMEEGITESWAGPKLVKVANKNG